MRGRSRDVDAADGEGGGGPGARLPHHVVRVLLAALAVEVLAVVVPVVVVRVHLVLLVPECGTHYVWQWRIKGHVT